MQNLLTSLLIFRNPSIGIHVHLPMKEYKKLHLKNDDDSDRLIDHLNQGWELFREFTGWVIVCKDQEAVAESSDFEIFKIAQSLLESVTPGTLTIKDATLALEKAKEIYMRGSISPDELGKPVFRPHREWFEMLKEPLRSQALDALGKFPLEEKISSSMSEAFSAAFSWKGVGEIDKWGGVYDFFEGRGIALSDSEYNAGYALAKQCAPDGWEQQGAGE